MIKNLDINKLSTKNVLQHFVDLNNVPRASGDSKKVSDFLSNFFKKIDGVKVIVDKALNIYLTKEPTVGYENSPSICLQMHMDMVPNKTESSNHNFHTDPIEMEVTSDGQWIKANNTTLGADDGISIAMVMELFSSNDVQHGPLEVVITADEEIGMIGALAFDSTLIKSKYYINLDTEDSNKIYYGCPGITAFESVTPFKRETSINKNGLSLILSDFAGGHSAGDIHLLRLNAIKIGCSLLNHLKNNEINFKLINFNAGVAQNCIPDKASIDISLDCNIDISKVIILLNEFFKSFKDEYKKTDPNMQLTIAEVKNFNQPAIESEMQNKIINFGLACHTGLIEFLSKFNILNYASNLGIYSTNDNVFMYKASIRGFQRYKKNEILESWKSLNNAFNLCAIKPLYEANGYLTDIENASSAKVASKVFKRLFNKEPIFTITPGCSETGIVLANNKTVKESISFGCTMKDFHTTNEMLHIGDIEVSWKFLKEFLKEMK